MKMLPYHGRTGRQITVAFAGLKQLKKEVGAEGKVAAISHPVHSLKNQPSDAGGKPYQQIMQR
jgi:hypothetical protein